MTGIALGVLLIAIVVGAIYAAKRRRDPDWLVEPSVAAPTGGSDVSVLRVAIDGTTSKFVVRELERITTQYSGAELLRETGLLLRRVREEWIYGGAINDPLRSLAEAKQAFASHVAEAKSARPGAPGSADPRAAVVVSIIVCAQGELVTVSQASVVEELRRALEAGAYRSDLVAVEVAWSACAASELPTRYPELIAIAASTEGKIRCANCGGAFVAELVTCPHCGAPARAA